MPEEITDPVQQLQQEIEKLINHRKKWEVWDFRLAHIFLWASIIASFVSSILIASEIHWNKFVLAAIVGIPGIVITIDKTLDFATRSVWGATYRIELEELKDKLVFKKTDPYEAAMKFREICKRYELAYAKIGFFAKNKNSEEGNKEI